MSDVAHALLGASSAHRWLNCPGSVLLTADLPDTTSEYSAEGTLAHEVCEAYARNALARKGFRVVSPTLDTPQDDAPDEMKACAQTYLEAILDAAADLGETPYIALEQRVDYSRWVPDGFGTADCVIIGTRIMHVIDYKHGKGVRVDAEDNPQLMLYALGALARYSALYDITRVRWSIVQPRNGGVSEAPETSADALRQWAEDVVKPAAARALTPGAPLVPGEHCRFCKARATCRARSDAAMALQYFPPTAPALLTPEEIGERLRLGRDLAAYLKDLEDHALGALLGGAAIPGWKAVEGRAIRAWTSPDEAFRKAVEIGVPEEMLWEKKPVTLAQLEKTLGKKGFAPLNGFVTTPPGKPALAPDTDKRPAIFAHPDDFAE